MGEQPLTHQKNIFSTHKVLATVGFVLIIMILFLSGIYYVVLNKESEAAKAENTGPIDKVVYSYAKPATASAKEETANWILYKNTYLGYSVKIPKNWLSRNCDKNLDFFAPKKDLLGVCNSGFAGISGIRKDDYATILDRFKSDTKNIKIEPVKIGTKDATKISGLSTLQGFENYISVTYLLKTDGVAFVLTYFANPSWDDQTENFDLMISTFKFL